MRKNEKIPINQENQLHQYAAAGNFEALKESIDALIKQRMSIETIFNLPHTEYGTRFLSFAIQYGRLKLIKDLADEYSSKINLGNCIAKDDILCCCLVSRSEYRTEMLPYFLKNAKKFNLSEANIKAALGDQDYFQRSPNTLLTPDQNGLTPLYYAIIAKQEDIIALKPEATLGDIIQVNGQDRRGLAAAYYNLGLAYVSRRDYGSAIKAYKEAIELRKQITVPIDQDRREQARTYNNLGVAFTRQFAIKIQNFNFGEPKANCLEELEKATASSYPIECIPLLKALYKTIQKTTDSEEPLRRIANYGVEFSNSLIETDNQPVLDEFFPKLFLFCEASIKNNPPNMEAISQLRILVLLILKFKDDADIPQDAVDKLNEYEQKLKQTQLRLQSIIESCSASTLVALHSANKSLHEELAAKNMRIAELEAQVEKLEKTQEQAKEIQPASTAVNHNLLWSNANKRKPEEESGHNNQNKQARTPINSQTFSSFERA